MTIFYIKMKIRAGGGALGQQGGALGQQGAPPAIPLCGKHYICDAYRNLMSWFFVLRLELNNHKEKKKDKLNGNKAPRL